ncbi:MAG TPA: hypothetical protein VH092_25070 [Urbifossiella sp.]|jgi:hypothetical protein|nr:hypothetical protein [Urbifossiella sp.]
MVTRFYLPSTGAADASPGFDAGWEYTAAADRLKCVTTKISSSMTSKTGTETSSTANEDILVRQYVSDPIGAQTITGTVKGQIRAQESGSSGDQRAQVVIKVVSNDGSTVTGTLLAMDTSALSNEFATTLTNRKFPKGSSGASLSSVAANSGDRIVIEIGARKGDASSTNFVATLSFGDNSGTDLAEDEVTTTANNPWIEFSQTLSFSTGMIGSAAVTEAGDSPATSGTELLTGTSAVTEGNDIPATTGVAGISGSSGVTEAGDTPSSTGKETFSGSATVTEASDTPTASGLEVVTGTSAITEAADAPAATGLAGIRGSTAVTEAGDTPSATGAEGYRFNSCRAYSPQLLSIVLNPCQSQGLSCFPRPPLGGRSFLVSPRFSPLASALCCSRCCSRDGGVIRPGRA